MAGQVLLCWLQCPGGLTGRSLRSVARFGLHRIIAIVAAAAPATVESELNSRSGPQSVTMVLLSALFCVQWSVAITGRDTEKPWKDGSRRSSCLSRAGSAEA